MNNGAVREPRALIVDPDRDIVEVIATYLRDDGYGVVRAYDGEEALRLFVESQPDIVLLDLTLPKGPGLEVFRRMRAESDVPVIIVTARSADTDRIVGLELGADDYVTKPFSPRELVARVGAVLRRSRCSCGATRRLRPATNNDDLEIDRNAHEARRRGRSVQLTPTEFRILDALARHSGQILTRAQLLDYVASEGETYDRTLDKHIANLRKKIEDDPSHPRYVVTVFGVGYKFSA